MPPGVALVPVVPGRPGVTPEEAPVICNEVPETPADDGAEPVGTDWVFVVAPDSMVETPSEAPLEGPKDPSEPDVARDVPEGTDGVCEPGVPIEPGDPEVKEGRWPPLVPGSEAVPDAATDEVGVPWLPGAEGVPDDPSPLPGV